MTLSPEFLAIVSLAGGISAIIACVKVILTPLDKIKQNSLEIAELKKSEQKRNEMDKAMLNALQAMTNHMIDGNGIDKLKASRSELQHAINDIATTK